MFKFKSPGYYIALVGSLAMGVLFSGYPFRWTTELTEDIFGGQFYSMDMEVMAVEVVLFGILCLVTHLSIGEWRKEQAENAAQQTVHHSQSGFNTQGVDGAEDKAQFFDYALVLQKSFIAGLCSIPFSFVFAIFVMGTKGTGADFLTDILVPALGAFVVFAVVAFPIFLSSVNADRKCPTCHANWSMLLQKSVLTDNSRNTENHTQTERRTTNGRTYTRDIFYEIQYEHKYYDEYHSCKNCQHEEIRPTMTRDSLSHTKKVTAVGEWEWAGY